MYSIYDDLSVLPFNDYLFRNIKSIRVSQELFDDLSDNEKDWEYGKKREMETKSYKSINTGIDRPFEEASFIQSIQFPFDSINWAQSRYSTGSFGVWYGGFEFETTIYETVHHWQRFINAAQFKMKDAEIISERRVFKVNCDALLLDFRDKATRFPALVDRHDYTFTQSVGEYIYKQGHPGLASKSARCEGNISAIFTPKVLNNPQNVCYLSYKLDTITQKISVERKPGKTLLEL